MYVGDVRLPNMLHAALLRSTHAHARIRSVDVKKALGLAGVVGVWTGREIENRISPISGKLRDPPGSLVGRGQTRAARSAADGSGTGKGSLCRWQPVAHPVVAEDRHRAEDAIDEIAVDYETLPAVVDPHEALKAGATLVHEESKDNVVSESALLR